MPLTPTPLPTALAHLLSALARTSELVVPAYGVAPAPEYGELGPDTALPSPPLEPGYEHEPSPQQAHQGGIRRDDERRALDLVAELGRVRALVEKLQHELCELCGSGVSAAAAEMVELRAVAAVVGAGGVVVDRLEGLLKRMRMQIHTGMVAERGEDAARWWRQDRREEVWEMVRGLRGFGRGCWSLLMLLESATDEAAADGREKLSAAADTILGKESELSREVKVLYPQPEAGSGTEDRTYQLPSPGGDADTICVVDDVGDSDSDTGPPTPSSSEFAFPDTVVEGPHTTLLDVSSPDDILVPVPNTRAAPAAENPLSIGCSSNNSEPNPTRHSSSPLRVITVTPTGVDISPLPDNLQTAPAPPPIGPNTALSADTVFQRPEVTDQIVLDFFRRAIRVSRFAAHFSLSTGNRDNSTAAEEPSVDGFMSAREAAQRQQLSSLGPRQLRELCTDLYDELVRRNVEDQNRAAARHHGNGLPPATFVQPGGLGAGRLDARARLAALADTQLARFLGGVLVELERRGRIGTGSAFARGFARAGQESRMTVLA